MYCFSLRHYCVSFSLTMLMIVCDPSLLKWICAIKQIRAHKPHIDFTIDYIHLRLVRIYPSNFLLRDKLFAKPCLKQWIQYGIYLHTSLRFVGVQMSLDITVNLDWCYIYRIKRMITSSSSIYIVHLRNPRMLYMYV